MAITDNLPKGDSPSLALVHPTDAEKLIQFKLNAEEWCGALKLPAYLRREDVLAATEMTRDGGISYWILVDTSLPNNPLDPQSRTRLPLASCETYRKKAWVWQDGTLKEVICHGVGSVFCANHLRKRGYAQRMMTELGEMLKTYQTEDGTECLFSVLYSDIGKVSTCCYANSSAANDGRNSTIPSAGSPSHRRTSPFPVPLAKTSAVCPQRDRSMQKICKTYAVLTWLLSAET